MKLTLSILIGCMVFSLGAARLSAAPLWERTTQLGFREDLAFL